MEGARRRRRPFALLALPAAALVVAGLAPVTAQAADAPYQVVTDQLRNPRGLDLSADGRLYVAEGGQGGEVCFEGAQTEEGGPLCAGPSARVSRIDTRSGSRRDYVTGLMSVGGPLFAIGASGVAVKGNQVYALMGANDRALPPTEACGGGPACTAAVALAGKQLGHLLRGVPSGRWSWRQDVGAFDYDWTVANKDTIGAGVPGYQPGWAQNPDFQPGDSNSYGLTAAPGGTYSVDGGSNTLTWIPQRGTPRIVAALPDPDPAHANAYDAVPTCVTTTSKGVFVADLNGRVFLIDGSSITVAPHAVSSQGGAFLAAAGGCDNDGHGNVYVSDIFTGGMVKVALSTMTMSWVRPPGTFNFPSGVALAKDGTVYVANNSVCPDFPTPVSAENPCGGVTGQVVRLHA